MLEYLGLSHFFFTSYLLFFRYFIMNFASPMDGHLNCFLFGTENGIQTQESLTFKNLLQTNML